MRSTLPVVLLYWLMAIGSGCNAPPPPNVNSNSANAKDPVPKQAAKSELPPPVLKGPPVTSGKFFEAAKEIESSVSKGLAEFGDKFDYTSMIDIALSDLELDQTKRNITIRSFVQAGALDGLMLGIVNNAANGGSYRFVRLHQDGDRHRALFRLVEPQGLNYHVLELAENGQGEIRVNDIFMAMSGEPFSRTIRQLILPVMKDDPSVAKLLADPNHPDQLDYEEVRPLIDAAEAGEFQQALQLYHQMTERTRQSKLALTLRLQCALVLGDATEFEQAVRDYREQFPQEVGADLVGVVFYLDHKDATAANRAIDRIDHYIGGDSHLNVVRGRVAAANGDLETAEKLLLQAATAPDALPDCYLALVDVSVQQRQFDKTLKHFLEMERRFQLKMNDLSTLPEYAPFVASPQYQEWLKRDQKP